jgi:hypothetical protein
VEITTISYEVSPGLTGMKPEAERVQRPTDGRTHER